MEMGDQGGWESTFPNVVEVLFKAGEYGVFGFSYVVFFAGVACDDVDYVAVTKRE